MPIEEDNDLFPPRHWNGHHTLGDGDQIGMMGQHSTKFITFRQGVLPEDIEPVHAEVVIPARMLHVPESVGVPAPAVVVPAPAVDDRKWVWCQVDSNIVSAYIMEDVDEVRVLCCAMLCPNLSHYDRASSACSCFGMSPIKGGTQLRETHSVMPSSLKCNFVP